MGGVDIADGAHDNLLSHNLVSGNRTDGIALFNSVSGPATSGNRLTGNTIGLAQDGSPLPNLGDGVFNVAGATGSIIQGNTIAHNTGFGVWVVECAGNTVSQNSIYANVLGGIRSGKDGSPCQPAPSLTARSTTEVAGNTTPNARVEIFPTIITGSCVGGSAQPTPAGTSPSLKRADSAARMWLPQARTRTATLLLLSTGASLWTVLLFLNGDNDLAEDMSILSTISKLQAPAQWQTSWCCWMAKQVLRRASPGRFYTI
jgi:parallel beta-helix repeat protein